MALVTRGSLAARFLLRGLVLGLAGASLACGDSLVDGTYSGTPRFTVKGSVNGSSEYVDGERPEVRVAVFWTRKGPDGADQLIEQPGTAQRAEYYRPFEMHLFDEPGAEHLVTSRSGVRHGVAWFGAYQDANDNGHKDEAEPIIGSSVGRLLIRATAAMSAQESPTGAPLAAGWHIVSTPLNCPSSAGAPPGGQPPAGFEPVADGECGVPLGDPCRSDADCGGGVCIKDFIGHWPAGACAIPEPPPNGCRQRGSTLVTEPNAPESAYWLKSCAETADCGRVAPYQCDQQFRVCRPSAEVPVEMNDRAPPRSFCKPSGTPPPQ